MFDLEHFAEHYPLAEKILNHTLMTKFLLVTACVFIFYLAAKLLNRAVRDVSIRRALGDLRVMHISRLMNIGMVFCSIVVMCLILGLGYSEISVFLSSIFAVVGIALFAQWSILSNVTASMIIFFGFPYQVRDRIQILDKDGDMTGVIVDITLFHVILKREDGNLITYPNTLILQKAVLKIDHPIVERQSYESTDILTNINQHKESTQSTRNTN
jgi:small-conductance mechanosensitive channel